MEYLLSGAHVLVYRGRAIPLVWKVLEHSSSSVAHDAYSEVLDKVAELLPFRCPVVFTADRRFRRYTSHGPSGEIGLALANRIKGSFWIYRHSKRRCKVNRIPVSVGKARFWHDIYMTKKWYGPVHLALGRPQSSKDSWFVLSDEPTEPKTFEEYGLRFDIEELLG